MKIRLTEGQYKRILAEDNNLKVTKPIRKMFELLHRNWDKLSLTLKSSKLCIAIWLRSLYVKCADIMLKPCFSKLEYTTGK